ncbi:MAG TPA: CpsD/CapB family tyrosine-protein kinase [Kiloniellales bacterium]
MDRLRTALDKARNQDGARRPPRGEDKPAESVTAPPPACSRRTSLHRPPERLLRDNRVAAHFTGTHEADVFRMLRTQVLGRLHALGARTLGISSAREREGKTLVAVNLAVSLSMDVNQTVLLVDLDLRRPAVHRYFGLRPERGFDDVLTDGLDIADCLVNPGYERLVVLPTRTPLARSSDLLSSPRMVALAEELRSRYPDRLVIYDLPPVLVADDCLAFLRHLDACLLVVEDGATRAGELHRALGLIEGGKVIGTVLNKGQKGSAAYYDYY